MLNNFDYLFKITIVGQAGVGKTSIMNRYVDSMFPETHFSTIGVDHRVKTIVLDDKKTLVKLQIWDTAGQERFKALTTSYLRGTKGIMLVFALNNMESFQKLQYWMDVAREHSIDYQILVGNKSDLTNELEVSRETIDEFLKIYPNMIYIQVSAKTGESINEAFSVIANGLVKVADIEGLNKNVPILLKLEEEGEKRTGNKCCGGTG